MHVNPKCFRDIPMRNGLDHSCEQRTVLVYLGLIFGIAKNTQYVVYSLTDEDRVVNIDGEDVQLYSLKSRYLAESDPTEYRFVKRWMPSWRVWLKLKKNPQFREHLEFWREELEVKLMSAGMEQVIDLAGDRNYHAAKFLVEKGWIKRERGRPTKKEIEGEKRKQAKVMGEFKDDLDRLSDYLPGNA